MYIMGSPAPTHSPSCVQQLDRRPRRRARPPPACSQSTASRGRRQHRPAHEHGVGDPAVAEPLDDRPGLGEVLVGVTTNLALGRRHARPFRSLHARPELMVRRRGVNHGDVRSWARPRWPMGTIVPKLLDDPVTRNRNRTIRPGPCIENWRQSWAPTSSPTASICRWTKSGHWPRCTRCWARSSCSRGNTAGARSVGAGDSILAVFESPVEAVAAPPNCSAILPSSASRRRRPGRWSCGWP